MSDTQIPWTIIVEVSTEHNFIVTHIDYTQAFISTNQADYVWFSDMLKSSLRVKASLFLQKMISEHWKIIGQSSTSKTIYYTLVKTYKANTENKPLTNDK